MRIAESKLRSLIKSVLLETMTPEMQAHGEDSEAALEDFYEPKKKGIKIRPSKKGINLRDSRNKKKIINSLGLSDGVFDKFANSGKSKREIKKELYDASAYKKPKNLNQTIRNYNLFIAIFKECDLNYLIKDSEIDVKLENYIDNEKYIEVVTNDLKSQQDSKLDYFETFRKNKNFYLKEYKGLSQSLIVINRVSASNTYTEFELTKFKFKSSDITKFFVSFLEKNNYTSIHSSNIAQLKKISLQKLENNH